MRLAGADLVLFHILARRRRLWGKIGLKEKVAQVFNLCHLVFSEDSQRILYP